ncbi:GNAT family N-acetyltransferase [Streptomyces sp. NPDC091280]|uniref:GNAT family N-acetyltransferase n=1 Tax=Streptomyces sp. NPDC091280 TaxID=3365984 RepID=UPI0037FCE5B4
MPVLVAISPRQAADMGVGSALLETVREVGRKAGYRRLVTDVWEFNEDARASTTRLAFDA